MQHYTTIEQSKKLVELGLNPETADMYYHGHCSPLVSERVFDKEPSAYQSNKPNWDYPCWSLGALLEVMPKICEDENDGGCYPTLCKGFNTDMWHCVYRRTLYVTDWYKSSINAAFEMVVWLLENNYIRKGE